MRDIIILETDRNKKGDLFNRLVYDVFHALGFGEVYYDVAKTGREIDMLLKHRTENRVAIVESKAHEDKIGGADINKFVGLIDVERRKYEQEGNSVVGYYISKSGFKDSAIEQENERARSKRVRGEVNELILLGPNEIVAELVQGKVLCSLEKAVDAVSEKHDKSLVFNDKADLVVCEKGWIWVLYYSKNEQQDASHFAFVHADGKQLVNNLANELISEAKRMRCAFSELEYIEPEVEEIADKQVVRNAYYKYLENELGEIQFEGMPTDKEAGAVKVNLENIFVPLRFTYKEEEKGQTYQRETPISGVLSRTTRAAILAKPGGGKSTLIRRIALAYAFPARREKVNDNLPEHDWFPTYIRCRDIGEDATKSISEIIGTIVQRAEITRHKKTFDILVEDALQSGNMLLLIDGLDEISNERQRICFVNQLRTFVATYPKVHLLITSRETGFRVVAGTLASYCEQYSIANLNEAEIKELSLKWHQAILGKSEQTMQESNKVSGIILNDERILMLAENPLLLTTLLFVKRWVGYLPTKKGRLYEEMVKLLLVTWNAVGHEKLDMDESEPQLAYVAYKMMTQGQQKITKDELEKCIIEARRVLPELLSYTSVSPSKFIEQVEERSSLLIQLGLEENESGKLVPSYEFSHLSFQEYLAAKAIAQLWIPNSFESNLLEVIKPYVEEQHWSEVIPLAAVLSGRQSKPLIEYLVELSAKSDIDEDDMPSYHLANCIASEVPMSRELLEKAISCVVRKRDSINRLIQQKEFMSTVNIFDTIIKGKYKSNYAEVVERMLFASFQDECIYEICDAWIELWLAENGGRIRDARILKLLQSSIYETRLMGALLMLQKAFTMPRSEHEERYEAEEINEEIFGRILQLLKQDDVLSVFVAAWCIAWSGYNEANVIPQNQAQNIFESLLELWECNIEYSSVKRVISWALYSVCSSDLKISRKKSIEVCVEKKYESTENEFDGYAAIHIAILLNLWSRKEVLDRIKERNFSKWAVHKSYFLEEQGYDIEPVIKKNMQLQAKTSEN